MLRHAAALLSLASAVVVAGCSSTERKPLADAGTEADGGSDAGARSPGAVLEARADTVLAIARRHDSGAPARVRVKEGPAVLAEVVADGYSARACAALGECEAGAAAALGALSIGRHRLEVVRVDEAGGEEALEGSPLEVEARSAYEPDDARLLAYELPDSSAAADLTELLRRHLNVDAETGVGFPVCTRDGTAPASTLATWGRVPGAEAQGLYWAIPDAVLMSFVEPSSLGSRRYQCGAMAGRFGLLFEGDGWPIDRFGYAWWDRYSVLPAHAGPWQTGAAQGVSFPHYAQFGHCVGWEFNHQDGDPTNDGCALDAGDKLAGWSAARGALLAMSGFVRVGGASGGAVVRSAAFSLEAAQAPFVEVHLAAGAPGDLEGLQLSWTGTSPGAMDVSRATLPPARFPATYAQGQYRLFFPVFLSPQWTGTITSLELRLPSLGAGSAIDLNYVRPSYDSRWPVGNAMFLLATERKLLTSSDGEALLASQLSRVRRLAGFIALVQARPTGLDLSFFPGFDGIGDAVGRSNGGSYYDMYPMGRVDLPSLVLNAAGLEAAARLEEWAARAGISQAAPQIDLPDGSAAACPTDPSALRAKAAALRAQLGALWRSDTGRYVFNVDANGAARDLGYLHHNLEALAFDQVPHAQAESILDWLTGAREVPGDTSRGTDLYRFRFAPRARTVHDLEQLTWVLSRTIQQQAGYRLWRFGNQQLNGGTGGLTGYYALLGLAKHGRAEALGERLDALLSWYRDVRAAGGRGRAFYRAYYDEDPSTSPAGPDPLRGYLQGCAGAAPYPGGPNGNFGAIGLDCEYIADGGIIAVAPLDALLGLSPVTPDELIVAPTLPPGLAYAGARNVWFGGNRLRIIAERDGSLDLRGSEVLRRGATLRVRARQAGNLIREDGATYPLLPAGAHFEALLPVADARYAWAP